MAKKITRPARRSKKIPKRLRGTVAVIGLGYVGLPLACLAAEKGYRVIGINNTKAKVDLINNKVSPIKDAQLQRWLKKVDFTATTDFSQLRRADYVIICVPTPVTHDHEPDLRPVISASEQASKYLRRRQVVILESTVNPGVCEEVVLPILEQSGKKVGRDFSLAHCPERINPGDKKWSVRNIPRVVGATDSKGLAKALKFYDTVIENTVKPMKSIKEAEATKILENSFRDVNIAFINEIAQSFKALDIDVLDVIEGAKTKPFAFLAHYPSCGIGGHCIPVDPYYLIERAKKAGFDHKFLSLAREINNGMPAYTVDQLMLALNELGMSVKNRSIAVLGLSYKANIEDTRESPSYEIIKLLRKLGAKILIFDPHVPGESNQTSLEETLKNADAVILATNHKEFLELEPRRLKRYKVKVVVDGKNVWSKKEIVRAGILYRGIGR